MLCGSSVSFIVKQFLSNKALYSRAQEEIHLKPFNLVESGVDPKDVAAISFDSQMAGIGAIDEEHQSVSKFDSWLDMRCEPQIKYLEENFGELITKLTGCPPTCDHGPKILWWKEERPLEYAKTAKFVMPGGYA